MLLIVLIIFISTSSLLSVIILHRFLPFSRPLETEASSHSTADPEMDLETRSSLAEGFFVAATWSTCSGRSTRWVQNFLKRKGRLTYNLNPELKTSFSEDTGAEETCKCGCTEILW